MHLESPNRPVSRLAGLAARVRQMPVLEQRGKVVRIIGLVIESQGPLAAMGEVCRIESAQPRGAALAEVVGFRDHHVLLMPLGQIYGIQPGDEVIALGSPLRVPVGPALKGRILDGLGNPIDDAGPIAAERFAAAHLAPPNVLKRQRILQRFQTGIKAIDTFLPCGRGQRLGIFAGSGVGKSTLLGMMASRAEADVNVIALVGERGREVREFIEKDLDAEGRKKSVVVAATSDQPALARLKGAFVAMAIAEYFRDQGQNVLLMMDSVTRFAMAQREIGLAVGEPPATRGYTPSVFSLLPQLLERAGTGERGSITGLFTVLVEQDDMNDPIADAVRSILDGHIVLARELATQNHYPAIDVLESVSRLARDLCSEQELELAGKARESMAIFRKNQDLINLGAYTAGSNPAIDQAIRVIGPINGFLRQGVTQSASAAQAWQLLSQAVSVPQPPNQPRLSPANTKPV